MREPGQPTFETHTYHLDALILALRSGAEISEDKKAELIKLLQEKPQTAKITKQLKAEKPTRSAVEAALAEMDSYLKKNNGRPQDTDEIRKIKGDPNLLAQANAAMADQVLIELANLDDVEEINDVLDYFTQFNRGFVTFQQEIPGISPEKKLQLQKAIARVCRKYLQDDFLKDPSGDGPWYMGRFKSHVAQHRNNSITGSDFDRLQGEVIDAITNKNSYAHNKTTDDANYKKFKSLIDTYLRETYGV